MPVEIVLSSGQIVKVYAVSPLTLAAAEAKTTLPSMPMVERIVETSGGSHPEQEPVPQDSLAYKDFLLRWQAADAQRTQDSNEVAFLFGLKDVQPPADDDWLEPLRYAKLQLHDGPLGRKLDFIEHCLFETQADIDAVLTAVGQLSYAKGQSAKSLENSFRIGHDDQQEAGDGTGGKVKAGG